MFCAIGVYMYCRRRNKNDCLHYIMYELTFNIHVRRPLLQQRTLTVNCTAEIYVKNNKLVKIDVLVRQVLAIVDMTFH